MAMAAIPAFARGGDDMLVSTEWLSANLRSVVVLDVATKADFLDGHIPGARLLEIGELLAQTDGTENELPSIDSLERTFTATGVGDRRRIIVCSRDPLLAARAWFTLDYLGHAKRAALVDGGYRKWIAEEREVETGLRVPTPAPFHADVNAGVIVRLRAMRQLVQFAELFTDRFTLIDARSPDQFAGLEAGSGVPRPGRIPGAVNVPWQENMTGGTTPVFRSMEELCDLYAAAGVTEKTANTIYCRTGMQAAVTYFVLKYLGYHASLYDGSFIEWSNTRDTLVVRAGQPPPVVVATPSCGARRSGGS
jgi:thiosulfate/3-mercaptopyruvate sulfurtransferase